MAIRPADLQLAYLAAPQSAAQANAAQAQSQAAQAASAAAFASHIAEREETIAEATHVEGAVIRTSPDGDEAAYDGEAFQKRHRRHGAPSAEGDAYELGDDEHFIDVTA